ncbi:putative hydroxypyruvate isomerase [Amblyomma americanum]
MPLKFAANISTMFRYEPDMLARIRVAKEKGFKAVECQFPYKFKFRELSQKTVECGIPHVLINSYPGTIERGELGCAAIPGRESEFLYTLETSIKYAKALQCKKIHVMAGITGPEPDAVMEALYVKNLLRAAHLFEKEGIVGVIEPLCKEVKPGYFLSSYEQAAGYIKKINHKNIRLLMDVFHLQMTSGNLTNTITTLFPFVEHIQISQAPYRTEPGAPGEIDYKYILKVIEKLGYTDWIGLEFTTQDETADGLYFLSEYGYSL